MKHIMKISIFLHIQTSLYMYTLKMRVCSFSFKHILAHFEFIYVQIKFSFIRNKKAKYEKQYELP